MYKSRNVYQATKQLMSNNCFLLVNIYLIEESSTKFPQIMKEYIKKLFSPKNICQGIKNL